MQYLLLMYGDEARPKTATREEMMAMYGAFQAYVAELKSAGAFIDNRGLQPSANASHLRVRDDAAQVLDGPYADTKEQLAGYFLIEAADLDAARAWAAKCPTAKFGTMEVRPIWGQG